MCGCSACVDNSVRLGLSSLRGHRRLMPCLARAPSSGGRSVTPHVGSSTSPGRRRRRPCRPTTSRTRRLTASTRPTCKAICRRSVSAQTWHLLAIFPVGQARGIIDPYLSRAATRAFNAQCKCTCLGPHLPTPHSPLPTPPPLSCPTPAVCYICPGVHIVSHARWPVLETSMHRLGRLSPRFIGASR